MNKLRDLDNMLEKYQMIFDFSSIGICITEINGSISMNNTFCAMLGYSNNELLEADWKDITYKEDFNKHHGIFDIHSPQNNAIKKTEIRFVKKDSTVIWTEVTSRLKNSDDGNPEYLVSMIRDISDYKNIELKLSENEVRYKELFDNNPNPMWLYEIHTLKFLMVNNAAITQYGYTHNEFLNMTIKDIRLPEDIPELIKNLNGIDSTIQNSGTWRHRKKDGTLFLAKISSHSIKLNGYNARVIMAIDVTEKVAAKQNLVTEAAKLKSIIESTSDTIFSVDKNYCYTSFNSAHSNMMKKVGNATIELGLNFLNCLPIEQEKLTVKTLIDKALKGERVNESLMIGDDVSTQRYLNVLHNPVRDENGDVIGVSVFGKDITESKRALEQLEKREKEFQTLFQEAITGNYVSTPEGKIILCNKKFLDIFGFKSMEEALNTSTKSLYKNEGDRDKMKERILNEKKLENFELEMIRRDGKTIHILENIVGQFNNNGLLEKMFGYVIDISERKWAEDELLASKLITEGIINTIPVRVFWKDKNLVYLGCNTIFAADAGFSNPQEIIGKDDYQMGWRDQADLYRNDDRIVLESGKSKLLIEESQTTPEGKTITLLTSKIPLRNSKEEIIGILGIYIDITDRKLAEEKLHESEELFRITAENLTDVIYDWDIKENINWYGDIDSITGYPPGGFPRTIEGWTATVHPEDKDRVAAALQDHVKGVAAYAIEYRIRKRDGELRWWSARGTALRNDQGESYKMIGSITDITERKKVEAELFESESLLSQSQRLAHIGSWGWDLKGPIKWSEETYHIYGVLSETFKPTIESLISLVHPEDRTAMQRWMEACAAGKSPDNLEFRIILPDGSIRFISGSGNLIYDSENIPVYMGGTVQDITERKQAEKLTEALYGISQAIYSTENIDEFYQHIYRDLSSIISARNFFIALLANDEKKLQFVYNIDEKDGDEPRTIDANDSQSLTIEVLRSKRPLLLNEKELNDRYSSGKNRVWGTAPKCWLGVPLIISEKAIGVIVVQDYHMDNVYSQMDVSLFESAAGQIAIAIERKRTEETLRESEERYRSVSQTANDAIITTDSKGIVIDWNYGAEKIFGYLKDEMSGKNLSIIIPQTHLANHINGMNRIEQGGEHHVLGRTVELQGLNKSGQEFPLELSLAELETSSGKYFTGIIRDITERKLVESELIVAKEKAEESNRIKSIFFSNMSHELRTPLVGILGFADILNESLKDEFEKEMATAILHSGKRLLNTLSLILSLTEFETLKAKIDLKLTNVNLLCSDIIAVYKVNSNNSKVEFITEFQSNTLELKINNHWLRETLNHLIKNSVNYTESGFISIKTYKRVEPISRKSFGIIEVVDSGIGIPKDKQEIIFEEFRQASEGHGRNFEGTGLGITLAKKYLELMNGTISVESEEGKGTKFIISFPIDIETKTETPINNEVGIEKAVKREILDKTNSNIENKKILLVEDDEITRVFVKKCLSSRYDLETVNTGEQAIKVSTENKFDLILMDINLGKNMDGIAAVKIIRKINGYEKSPVIAMTAYASENDKKEFLSNGCSHYISKPFIMKELVELVNGIFYEKEEVLQK